MRHIGVLLAIVTSLLVTQPPASAADMDCADFSSQRAAQIFFLNHNPAADPHGLDADGDWVVCESLSGPYYYGTDPTPGGGSTPSPTPTKSAQTEVVKVLKGDLLKVKKGSQRAYKVRLLGATVPRGDSCFADGALRSLKKWIKPGRAVTVEKDSRAPKTDKQGHMLADVVTVNGGYTIGGTQVAAGWAELADYKFSERKRYKRWAAKAEYLRKGHNRRCVPNFGTAAHPYVVGQTFDLGPWRYQVGATDGDAYPEMQAEEAAAPGSFPLLEPPTPGWVYVRAMVTVTRIGSGSEEVDFLAFQLQRGSDIYDMFGPNIEWCTGSNYLGDQVLSQGQSLSAYACATIPAPLSSADRWIVDSQDLSTSRLVAVS